MNGDERLERRTERQVTDLFRVGLVGNIENDKPARAVGQISTVAFYIGPAMQHHTPLRRFFTTADILAFHPPTAHFDRVTRILDIKNLHDVSLETLGYAGGVDISSAVVVVPMGAVAAGPPVAQKLGVFRVFQIPDQDALTPGLALDMPPAFHDLFLRRHQ